MNARVLGLALGLALACGPGAARAQLDEAHEVPDGLRISLGVGLTFITGSNTKLNDLPSGDSPSSYASLPTPVAVLRLDYPLHEHWLLGVQGSFVQWDTAHEERLGYGNHATFDLSALFRVRAAYGDSKRHEIVATVALGPSFDHFEARGRGYGETIDGALGVNAGVSAGYQLKPAQSPFGFFGELGLTHHMLSQKHEYPGGGVDEFEFQPVAIFVRAGLMLLLFR